MSAKRTSLSRREFLKVAGSAAFAASAGSLLAGCVPPPAATTAPAEVTTAPAAAPTSKNVVLAIQAFAHDALKPVIAEWEQQTGMTVTLESGPTTGQEMMTKYSPAFQAKTSPVDVVSVDDVSGPAFARAGWIIPLDDVIPAETWQDFPASFLPPVDQDPFHSYEGKRYRVPHEFAVGYFWHRKDWFDEKGVTVPKTWDEFVQIGKEFTKDPVWGTTEGMLKPGLPFVYLAYLTAQAGGDIFKFDEATATAFQYCYDLIHTHKIMSESVLNQDYTQQNDLYMKDRVAMMRQWPYFWSVVRDNKEWYQEGRADIQLPPAGPAGPKSWWGGWGFSVPTYAPNLDAAKDLIAWVTNAKNAPILAQGQSWFVMPRPSILAVMTEGLPVYMKLYSDNNCLVPRPYNPRQAEAEVVVDDVGQLFLTKQMSLADAMKMGQERIAALG